MAKKQYFQESELVFKEKPTHKDFKDIEGLRFNRLLVIGFAGKNNDSRLIWYCKCQCGKIGVYQGKYLSSGHTKSCGCFNKEQTSKASKTHGHATPGNPSQIYTIWGGIIARCTCPTNSSYERYGARGITVCERWSKFENFLEDMGERPGKGYSIERIENDKGYYEENCRWATRKEQMNNTRRNRILTFNGRKMNITQWSEELKIPMKTIYSRIMQYKWPVHRALTEPVRK